MVDKVGDEWGRVWRNGMLVDVEGTSRDEITVLLASTQSAGQPSLGKVDGG